MYLGLKVEAAQADHNCVNNDHIRFGHALPMFFLSLFSLRLPICKGDVLLLHALLYIILIYHLSLQNKLNTQIKSIFFSFFNL